jgi:hypothetical protein
VPSFIEMFNAIRRTSTPLVVARTADPEATMKAIAESPENRNSPMILQDGVRGLVAVNEKGKPVVMRLAPTADAALAFGNPVEMLARAPQLPAETILFMANIQRYLHDPLVVQGIWNLRGQFKTNTRTAVFPVPDITLPPELSQDVVVLDEPLPTGEQIRNIVLDTYDAVNLKKPADDFLQKCEEALAGLSQFPIETVCAMSIKSTGIDLSMLWERKRQQIEQTPGLSVWRGKEKFADIGGCDNVKDFLSKIMRGRNRPRAIVFQDEIEKAFAGAAGDLSGATQELLGYQLAYMQDHASTGTLFIGHPGAAKSAISKAIGNEAGVPLIQFDLSAMKGNLVGDTGMNMRTALKVIEAISQENALWVATCNDIKNLPPELRRRYTFGTFFFDLPTPQERALIWKIYFDKYSLPKQDLPADTGWTGAEIKNCCDMAWRLEVPVKETAKLIVPMATSASERIANLRVEAHNRYISAAYPGPYQKPEGVESSVPEDVMVAVAVMSKGRKITTEESSVPTADTKKGNGKKNVN